MSASGTRRLIVLAAGRGTRLGPAAEGRPKAAVELAGRALLSWQLAAAEAARFHDVLVMRGYRPQALPTLGPHVQTLDNPVFDRTNMVFTLWLSREWWGDGVIVSYGDIVYAPSVLEAAWRTAGASRDGIAVVVDRAWHAYWSARFDDPLTDAETLALEHDRIVDIGQRPTSIEQVQGQYIGVTCFRNAGVQHLRDLLDRAARAQQDGRTLLSEKRGFPDAYMTDVLQRLIAEGRTLAPAFIDGGWLEIDTPTDLELARTLVRPSAREGGTLLEIAR